MSRRVTFLLNMLSPYWIPFYQGLDRSGWNVSIRVSTLQEPNRTYDRAALESVVRTGVDLAQLPGFTYDLRRLPCTDRILPSCRGGSAPPSMHWDQMWSSPTNWAFGLSKLFGGEASEKFP